jgi:hypothetical protein
VSRGENIGKTENFIRRDRRNCRKPLQAKASTLGQIDLIRQFQEGFYLKIINWDYVFYYREIRGWISSLPPRMQ